ncbi:MAG: hypothetical protein HUU14_03195 [Dehalococcoidia bacterium]|nr:MAG: hypothetical protein EDM76_03925 [bacterium]MCE7927996.1 hypothetical protein [Chloroflexi bacterium CFX7]MCK6563791.1 hypothetical protein [Dehalococcoidia bacterium]MCL4231423.1 hypothetical protein [Dehalococcoidia bacterium]NUQ54873.1 hypothetical protein [Dehalococcoidia bacterium]
MLFDVFSEARLRERELDARALEIAQRMQWYDSKTVERLERELSAARGRLQVGATFATGAR